MAKITIQENTILFERKNEIMRIEPYGDNCIRFRSTRNGKISDES